MQTGGVSTTNNTKFLWFCYTISGVGPTFCGLCEKSLTIFQLLFEGFGENFRHKVVAIVSLLPHPYVIVLVYRCTVVQVYMCTGVTYVLKIS